MKKLSSFLGVLAMAVVAPLAHADFEITINGVDCNSSVSATPNGSLACLAESPVPGVTILAVSTQGQQLANLTQQFSTTLSLENESSSAVTITIGLGVSNFSSPTIPPAPSVMDVSGLTVNQTNGSSIVNLKSCVDLSNGLILPTFCSSPAPGMAPPNTQITVAGALTKSNNSASNITTLTAPFSLTQLLTIVLAPGTPGSPTSLNLTASQVLTPVPEPMSVALLGGVLLLAGRAIRRKQKGTSV